MNLLVERFLSVQRQGGQQEWIAPWQITQGADDNPVVAIRFGRADFTGSAYQFLIGLLQTCFAPASEAEWRRLYGQPPSPETLRQAFEECTDAFEFDGDGARFEQDLELSEGEAKPVSGLFVEAPGGKTLRDNLDHFTKRGGIEGICPRCAAMAVYSLQTNAPSGGVGHRTSLRGGGPLTTLVLSDPREPGPKLWRDLWLNVLSEPDFLAESGNLEKRQLSDIFPWLAKTRTSETGQMVTPEDAHPAQMFWGMPRRIRLSFADPVPGTCDVCGLESDALVTAYLTKNYGINYGGPWRHPLSPHTTDKSGFPVPLHPQPGGITYRHWLGLVQSADSGNRMPAAVVSKFRLHRQRAVRGQAQLWAFGTDFDNMKARCWYESTLPLLHVEPDLLEESADTIQQLIETAGKIGSNLRSAVRSAWFRNPSFHKGDTSHIDSAFWQATEAAFYRAADGVLRALQGDDDPLAPRMMWLRELQRAAERLFDEYALSGPIEESDPRRLATARNDLEKFNNAKKLRNGLGLP